MALLTEIKAGKPYFCPLPCYCCLAQFYPHSSFPPWDAFSFVTCWLEVTIWTSNSRTLQISLITFLFVVLGVSWISFPSHIPCCGSIIDLTEILSEFWSQLALSCNIKIECVTITELYLSAGSAAWLLFSDMQKHLKWSVAKWSVSGW